MCEKSVIGRLMGDCRRVSWGWVAESGGGCFRLIIYIWVVYGLWHRGCFMYGH